MKALNRRILLSAMDCGQSRYALLLQGGHLIDAKNRISAVRDVLALLNIVGNGMRGGKVRERPRRNGS